MNRYAFGLICLLAACSSPTSEAGHEVEVVRPTAPPPARDLEGFARAVRGKLPGPRFSAMAPPVPLPSQVFTEGQISFTVQGHYGSHQARDGSWLIQVPADGSAEVTAIASSGGPWYAALNLPGDNNVSFDQLTIPLPKNVVPGDAIVLGSGLGGTPSPRPPAYLQTASGTVDEATAVVFVSYAVENVGPLYCPPAIGARSNSVIRGLRGEWGSLPELLTNFARLPSVIDLSVVYGPGGVNPLAWGATPPTIAGQLANHGKFAGDIYGEWLCAGRVPYTSHSGYGTNVAGDISTSMLLCCSTAPLAQRAPLVHALIQRAIHDLGRAADGCYLYPSGGHCWGRVPPMVMMGVLWGLDIFADPTPVLGERHPERNGFVEGPWWFGDLDPNFNVRWLFSFGDTADLGRHPSQWGDPNSPTHSTFGWAVGYMTQVLPALLGSACAIQLMGGERHARKLVQACRQQFKGPPDSARQELAAAGNDRLNDWWGKDYAGPFGFAAECWRLYAH